MGIRSLVPKAWGRSQVPIRRETSMTDPFWEFRSEVDRLFDRFFEDFGLRPLSWAGEYGAFQPKVDVAETESEIQVSAELPGLEEKDIEVSLGDGTLTLKGERRWESEDKGKDYHRREQAYGSFHRVIPLPAEVDADKANASFKNGVLTVTLPKAAAARSRKIEIEAA